MENKNEAGSPVLSVAKKAAKKISIARPVPIISRLKVNDVTIYNTSKGLIFFVPKGMPGKSLKSLKFDHEEDIKEWLKEL